MGSLSKQARAHIAVGIILNNNREVLISRRKPNTHLAGLLEFPGGKVEHHESPREALRRELAEELKIQVGTTAPLIQIPYCYADQKVLLDVFVVRDYAGRITANEKQELIWRSVESLQDADFPAANFGIIRAIQLPNIFPITPDYTQSEGFLEHFEKVIDKQEIKIIQLRSHHLKDLEYRKLAKKCAEICRGNEVRLILNRKIEAVKDLTFSGLHLSSAQLFGLKKRPIGDGYLVGASCHNAAEVDQANALKVDYIFIGAVQEKYSVPALKPVGWDGFSRLAKGSLIPAYAIGGLGYDALEVCVHSGGQGIAAIRSVWGQVRAAD